MIEIPDLPGNLRKPGNFTFCDRKMSVAEALLLEVNDELQSFCNPLAACPHRPPKPDREN